MTPQLTAAFDALIDECSEPDWDGYGSMPINMKSVELAKGYLSKLPPWVPDPELCCYPDGDVELEWGAFPDNYVSVTVTDHNSIIVCNNMPNGAKCIPWRGIGQSLPKEVVDAIWECLQKVDIEC